ncbi:MAG: glycine-rich domain-containing protein, partial [Beijerinckiaceae bacterium]
MRSDPALWERIAKYTPDDPEAGFTFSDRLARENGWSKAYARRTVEEYKRFLYLAVTAGHEVTPSEAVDQAWHLHLVYTRSYWNDLCRDVLLRPLHHGPTKGGAQENARFHDNYDATLSRYAQEFGDKPPADIWLPAEERFKDASRWRFVDTSRYWLVPALRWPFSERGGRRLAFVLAATTGLLASGRAMADDRREALFTMALLLFLLGLAFAVAIGARNAQAARNRRKKKDGGSGCG